MAATLYRLRSELRARRRSMLAIALLLGLGAGAVMAAAAGARRTDTAYPRLVGEASGAHVIVSREPGSSAWMTAPDLLADPAVEAVRPYRMYLMLTGPVEQCEEGTCVVGLAGGAPTGGPVDEMKLVEGRLPDQSDPSHAALTVVGAQQLDLRVGDTFPLTGVPFGEPFTAFAERARRDPLTMEVVGVVATPGHFPPQVGDETTGLHLTRAFYDRYPEASFGIAESLAVRLTESAAGVGPFLERVFERYPNTIPSDRAAQDQNVQRSFHLQALALWALAGVAGLTLLMIVAQTVARELQLGADDAHVLAAAGMTRAQRWVLGLGRAVAVASLGTAIAVPVAVAISPLLPRGLARVAEPSPGVTVDWLVLGLGAAAIIVLVAGAAAWPAWRIARVTAGGYVSSLRSAPAPSPAHLAARLGASPAVVAGARMALEPGRGRTAVPVRTTLTGVTLGIIAVVAALSFGSSLEHLLETPRLYGVTFDMVVGAETVDFRQRAGEVLAMPEVDGIAWGFDVGVLAEGEPLSGVMLDTNHPPLRPPLLEGRAPVAAERLEAVLGVASARRLGVGVGETFGFQVPDTRLRMEAVVVGVGALPTFDDAVALSDGVWFSHAGVVRALGQDLPSDKAFIDLAPGADASRTFQRMADVLGVPVDQDLWRPQVGTPSDLVSFGDVRRLPQVLAGLIGAIALGILAHAVRSAIRRRARDLAIMKTLGFTRRQTRLTVFANVTVLGIVTATVGIPLGVVIGRWLWRGFSDAQGIVTEHALSWASLAVALLVLTASVALVGGSAARAAARTRPAELLRAE